METHAHKLSWSQLKPPQRAAIVGFGMLEVALTAIAAYDLIRRPREQVRGPKLAWFAALPIQPFGPIAYLAVGRLGD